MNPSIEMVESFKPLQGNGPDDKTVLTPCYFPSFGTFSECPKRQMSTKVNLQHVQDLQMLYSKSPDEIPWILRGAWALVLRCYTGSDDICFGYQTIDDASLNEDPKQLGTLCAMLTARMKIEDGASLGTVVERAKDESIFCRALYPTESSGNDRRSDDPPYNAALMLRTCTRAAIARPPMILTLPEKCRIRLLVKVLRSGLGVFVEWWNSDLSTEFAMNVASVFDQTLSNILAKPSFNVGELDFCTGRDRQQIFGWNAESPEEVDSCVHEVIHDQALLRPNAEAVCAWDGNFTYRTLDRLAVQLACRLEELGVGPEVRVALCFSKSKWNIVAMLAVLKAGGAFVPLDATYPLPRLQALVHDVEARILLCSRQYAATLATIAETVLPLDDAMIKSLPSNSKGASCLSLAKCNNAAYLIFTSGSTGEPKGTVVEHRAYCSSAKAHAPKMMITSDSRVLQFAAHTFDSSLVESLTTLMQGGCVCVPSEEARMNNIAASINEMRVNHALLTPSFIGFMDPAAVPGLKSLVLAGEAMSQEHVATWSKINLVNGYGPTESSVAAVVNSRVTQKSDCKDMGYPVGVHCWIVDPHDHDRLMPVGCTGELLLEGPTLARCYHNNPQKTAESFISDPAWTKYGKCECLGKRFYKTGDLVRYNSEAGSLNFVGRKDTQIKLHGRRVELGEIEYHVCADSNTKHGLVLFPESGYYKGRLVVVLSLRDNLIEESALNLTALKPVGETAKDIHVAEIRERLYDRLPTYMVPSVWLRVEALPLLTSRKLDRKSVTNWLNNMTQDFYFEFTSTTVSNTDSAQAASEIEYQLLSIWSRVLGIPPSRIGLDHSFLSLGGDSISAMSCMSQCKRKGIGIAVQEVLRSKSVKELATCVKVIEGAIAYDEAIEEPFDLSPIQKLHFQVRDEKQGHFNQSFFLRLNRKTDRNDLRHAIEILISRHSMLRARFSQTGPNGAWQQRVTREIATSYRFRAHRVYTASEAKSAIAESQACLDIILGPLLAFDLFDIKDQGQLVSMIGHHLVIDLVSWRVILEDLEELLLNPNTSSLPELSLPFQTWCHLQTDHCGTPTSERYLPADDVPYSDLSYWGMGNCPNLYGDVVCEGFELDSAITCLLLTECHKSLQTELIDILLSSLLHSFGRVFPDRPVPAIYNESHGREPWDLSIDVSRTVGWFTALYPIFVQVENSGSIVETLIRIKDLRRRVPDSGRRYFATRALTSQGAEKYSHHYPMEIIFNYLGQYQQLERHDSLFQPVEDMAGETRRGGGAADVGQSTPRFGLFEISAVVVKNKLRFSFTFNRFSRHQDEIREWILQSQQALALLSKTLVSMPSQPTLSDFPLLSLNYQSLQTMIAEKLPQLGIMSVNEVEDAYPCSSMQQGILLSRTRDSSFYSVCCTYEVKGKEDEVVDTKRLADAWQTVIERHAMLRTVFAENLTGEDVYGQVVLKSFVSQPVQMQCSDDGDVLQMLDRQQPIEYNDRRPAHRFTICKTFASRVFCRLEMSHVIMDGTSISIIFRDLELAYAGTLNLKARPQFSGFISYLQGVPQDAAIRYWTSYLENMEPCHFPVLNDGRTAEKILRTLRLQFTGLPRLQLLCDKNGLTLSNIFHAAWSLTLRYYCSSDDVCFGYLSSCRDAPVDGIGAAVGPIINVLACRVNIPATARLSSVMAQIQKDYSESLPYKHASLAEVHHALRLAQTAVFNTCLSYRKLPTPTTDLEPALTFSEYGSIHDPTEYLLSINIEASDNDLAIDLDYWTDTVVDEQAQNVASTFIQSLENIIDHPTEEVGSLGTLSDRSKEQILSWNSNIPAVLNNCIHELIEQEAQEWPDAPAICAWDGNFSYAQLSALSSKLSHYLVRLGVVPEMLIPVCFDKSAWTIISMLAVLKAGGGCVPLDATHPKSALDARVLDAGAQVVLASPKHTHQFEDIVPYVISVSESFLNDPSLIDGGACTIVQPSNAAFVIFTSGSTGRPKGVVLEHRAFVTSAAAHGSALGIGKDTRFLQFAAYTFDISLEEIFTTLLHGGCVCVPSDDDRLNNLAGAINELGANFIDITPTVANFLQPQEVPCVKAIAIGGEPLTRRVREIWGKEIPLHNIYGPSECSVNCALNPNAGKSDQVNNIGRSIGSVSWVVDPADHNILVPIGCVGELLVEGPILARGYLNKKDKTKESFVENPAWVSKLQHRGTPCEDAERIGSLTRRMYKTGDLVRYNSDGSLVYLGRKDTQVKLNGQRIELGEIEYHIKSGLPAGSQSAVELATMKSGQKTIKALVAFLSLSEDGRVPSTDDNQYHMPMSEAFRSIAMALQSSLSSSLAAYMVPNLYIPVATMPLTSSGKLNRRMLRDMIQKLSTERISSYRLDGKSGRSPSTPTEKLLQHLWASVLDIDASNIGADDTFFKHGGDSVGAIRLVTAAREVGLTLTVASIFQTPKLSDVARNIASTSNVFSTDEPGYDIKPFSLLAEDILVDDLKEEIACLCQVHVEALEDIYPCTSVQEGLIALTSKQPGAYVTRNIYRLPADINIQRFRHTWEAVSESEAILRTRVAYTKARGFLQVVIKQSIAWQSVQDLEGLPEAGSCFRFSNGGALSEYMIVGQGTDTLHFVWTAHHALYDGWSIPMLLNKVESYYLNPRNPEPDLLSAYPRFIALLSGIDVQKSDDFWRACLKDCISPQFPRLPRTSYSVLAKGYMRRTTKVCRPSGVDITISSILRAAWALTLSIFSCCDDVIFGEILTGRDAPLHGITEIIGPTLATVPTRIHIDRDASAKDFLGYVQRQLAATMPYQFAGLQHIKRLSKDAAVACEFQNILAIEQENEESPGNLWNLLTSESAQSHFYTYPLNVSCRVNDKMVDIITNYDEDIISTTQTRRLISQFETFLENLSSKCDSEKKIGQMELLSPNDLSTIQLWNSKPLEFVDRCIHDMVQENALRQPEATAVSSWDVTLTYRELDQLSTSLACRLSEFKPGHGQQWFVPMCFEKSGLAIIVILAILKAGAAFVPLDPQHPISRLREIVTDLSAELVLCSGRHKTICEAFVDRTFPVGLAMFRDLPVYGLQTPSCATTNSAAYVMFTSGTTGKPKGIIIEHAAFCSGACQQAPACLITTSSRVLQFASYTFDASLIEILTTLLAGGCVCVPDEDTRLNAIADAINNMKVTTALLTPSVAQLIKPSDVPGLKTLVLVGEAMLQSHVSTWAENVDLVNGYGPSECSVAAAFKTRMSLDTDPTNVGRPIDTCWIVDPNNHNRLMPIGCVGELLIEGPTVGRGYLHNEVKTAESFIKNPNWPVTGKYPFTAHERRIYKTGDLVKYSPDDSGEIIYVGRKDNQAKLHGQRLELEEVEHYLSADASVRHAVVTLPKVGPCTGKLVATLSLKEVVISDTSSEEFEIVTSETASRHLPGTRERLESCLPAYMIPSNWIVLRNLPLLSSGKLDRPTLTYFVESMDDDTYQKITALEFDNVNKDLEVTDIEHRLQIIWGDVLNLPSEKIGLNRSFIHLGGDSISAMQVMSKCRSENLGVTVQDIIGSKSISELALLVAVPEEVSGEDADDQEFDLSPIQKLYFQYIKGGQAQFNQSMLLRLKQRIHSGHVKSALDELVRVHPMLRARFLKTDDGHWRQRIAQEINGSYHFGVHKYEQDADIERLIGSIQKSLNLVEGPVLAVAVFERGLKDSWLFITAHHLVIDVVSWRIILDDLERLLQSRGTTSPSSISFQRWCRQQIENARQDGPRRVLPLEDEIPSANFAYWGMHDRSNVYGDVVTQEVKFEHDTSRELLGSCHETIQTEIVDVILATLLLSFTRVFKDRERAPAIYNEGHGREPWDSNADPWHTVGWFTTLTPVHLPRKHSISEDGDLVKCIRWVKDLRTRTPYKGRQYFAHRFLTSQGMRLEKHWPMETTFNYLGQYQDAERSNTLLQPVSGTGQSVNTSSDIGNDVPRFALIEISAIVIQGCLSISFSYNSFMKRQGDIQRWFADFADLLREAPKKLRQHGAERTLSDFPLVPLTYDGMDQLSGSLLGLGISSLDEVENVYQCSPMQQGMLLTQLKDPEKYAYTSIFEVRSTKSDGSVSLARLEQAWQDVVRRHPPLRTIFIDSICTQSLMDQVVLKSIQARTLHCECHETEARKTLCDIKPLHYGAKKPPHRLSLCKTTAGRVFCRLDISHAISDGTSMPLLLRDLSHAYMGQGWGRSQGPLYSDFIAYLQSTSRDTSIAYWKQYLADVEPCLFPSLCTTKIKKHLGSQVLLLKKTTDLQTFCRDAGITASNLLQLVWGLVLRCYTGSDDICFGYLASGRDIPVTGVQDAVGVFINMLICRLNLNDALGLGDILQKTKGDFVRSMEHQTISLAEVQHELGLSETPLFNTVFTYQRRLALDESETPPLLFDILEVDDPSEYMIAVNVEVSDVSTEVHFSYWTDSLSEEYAGYIVDAFEQILYDILQSDNQGRTMGDLNYVSPRTYERLSDWNKVLPERIDKCIHELIEQQVLTRPLSTPAVCAWDANFTYTELEQLSVDLAVHLEALGVKAEVFVPLCFEKSAWAIVAQLAVLRAGGAFVSLDPSHPESRLQTLIDDVEGHLVLCSSKYEKKATRVSKSTFVVSRQTIRELRNASPTLLKSTVKPCNAAYIIFTSGSTGKPKGTVIEHTAISTSSLALIKAFYMDSTSRVFQFASYTFDASIMEILTTLASGGCICVPSDDERMNDLSGVITRLNANWAFLTPAVGNTINPENVPTLKFIVTGGEMMPAGYIEKWANRLCLMNAYGPTECTIIAMASTKVDLAGKVIDYDRSTIGRVLCARSWIADSRNHNRLMPIGGIGELILEGSVVARGYLNNKAKTKEVFIEDAAWESRHGLQDILQRKERMYRTGDLVRYNLDGTISYVSRIDTQIKLNGQRIELGEIEYQCRKHLPDQTQTAVELIISEGRTFAKKLAVFFTVLTNNNRSSPFQNTTNISDALDNSGTGELLLPMSASVISLAKKLEDALTAILPTYMIPKLFFPVSNLPWATSGKLDRRRLHNTVKTLSKEELKPYTLSKSAKRQAPRTKMEKTLQVLWEKVLGLASGSVSANDNFFGVGGDSLAAIHIVGGARLHGISLPAVNIFRHPILADMAASCEILKKGLRSDFNSFSLLQTMTPIDHIIDETAIECRVDKYLVANIYPCSSLQEGLITLSIKQPGAYVAQNVFRLSDGVDINQFKTAWQQTVDEFDMLRTRIVHTASMDFLQVNLKEQTIVWQTADSLQEVKNETTRLPEYNGGPLTRFTIIEMIESAERYLVLSIHHALYDGWSLSIVLKRVEDLYFRRASKPVETSYTGFIHYLLNRDTSTADTFWKSYLANVSSRHFPQSSHSSSSQISNMRTVCGSTDVFHGTLRVDITVPELIRAAWTILVSAHTSSNDVCFGETLTGRNADIPGVADIVGPVLTTVPTRITMDYQWTILEYLQEVHRVTTELIPHQHSGLQHIRRLSPDTSIACNFQNLLVIQTAEEETDEGLWTFETARSSQGFFTYPLVVECRVVNSRIETNFYYDENVISDWQTERLLYQFEFLLRQLSKVSKDDTRKLIEVEILSPEDVREIARWNQRETQCINQCIHELFRQRHLLQPEAPAVCAWDGNLTYHELAEYASRFAVYLVSLGVGPEVFIPICLDKSVWTIVTILGILMAGGAFVPLDPTHPVSRHVEILEELDAAIILCSPHYSHRYVKVVPDCVEVHRAMITSLPKIKMESIYETKVTSSNAAYVIFTSGTTGRAKGIIVEHRSFTSSSMAFRPALSMKENSRVLQFASLSFDAAVMEIFTTLICGGCVCVPSEEERLTDLAGAIQRMGISWTLLTPSVTRMIEPATAPCLAVLACGGETLSSEVITKWADSVKLINAYGPTEAAVVSTVDSVVSSDSSPHCIGHGTSSTLTWIVDLGNHDRLSPLGAIGELALEGPALARGYLSDLEKTAEAFVENPAWTSKFSSVQSSLRRIYKTGDLVRYNRDGSLEYIGRKDNQVKIHGQRIDLGEIEYRLSTDPLVRHVVVLLPKAGVCQQRIVAVLSLDSLASERNAISADTCRLLTEKKSLEIVRSELDAIGSNLVDQLPPYMLPQIWVAVETIPMLVSGKLDRKNVAQWVGCLSEDAYKLIMRTKNEEPNKSATAVEKILQTIWAQVLNLPLEKVKLNQSFLSLGGDSISAMAVMSRSRKQNMNFPLHAILRCESISKLALSAATDVVYSQQEERTDENFHLSPIQSLYLRSAQHYDGSSRFNQSFTLRLARRIEPHTLEQAIRTIISRHSMLRARFSKASNDVWQQRITKEIDSSYCYRVHNIDGSHAMPPLIANSQECLNIFDGPVFVVDLFESGDDQFVFLVASHLCVDMVSWRIILQDIQDAIESSSFPVDLPLPFQTWCALQAAYSRDSDSKSLLPFHISPASLSYWGMEGIPNTYGDVKCESFCLDEVLTTSALDECHKALGTEPIELFLSAILLSFCRVFTDRPVPALFNEGHGREAWDPNIDLSRTVGWFTTICPLQVTLDSSDDILDTLRQTKDTRRKIPDNGQAYFTHRFLCPESESKHAGLEVPMEILFNYLGRVQQLEREDSLFQQVDFPWNGSHSTATGDMGPTTNRLALFEISAIVTQGRLQFSFMYSGRMHHGREIRRWISECRRTLEDVVIHLKQCPPEPTLSDYPLLPLTYDGLRKLVKSTFPKVGITNRDQVEDIYPCSPVQEGILLSQLRNPNTYFFHVIFEPRHAELGLYVDRRSLSEAWQRVVRRHAALRTIFVDSVYKGGAFDQIVMRSAEDNVILLEYEDSEAVEKLSSITPHKTDIDRKLRLPHQLTICTTPTGRVLVKMEINHAVIDGVSAPILLRDLALSYAGRLPEGSGPLYSEYIRYIREQSQDVNLAFWKQHLQGLRPCYLPCLSETPTKERRLATLKMQFDHFPELQEVCEQTAATLANVMQAAWALVLRGYTDSDEVCFGYLSAGRDTPVNGIQDAVGTFINMLCCRVKLAPSQLLGDVSRKIQDDYLKSIVHQHCSLAQIQHELGLSGKVLFNTALSIQNHSHSNRSHEGPLIFDMKSAYDPSEYAVSLSIETARGDEGVLLSYWTDSVSNKQATKLASTMAAVLTEFVKNPKKRISELDLPATDKRKAPGQRPVRVQSTSENEENGDRQSLDYKDPTLQRLIDERVRETIKQLLKDGTLVSPHSQSELGSLLNDNRSLDIENQSSEDSFSSNESECSSNGEDIDARPIPAEASRGISARLEKKLLFLWCSMLDLTEGSINKEDSFFDLGGDSIAAMRLVGAAREEGLTLTVADVFRNPVFEDMLAIIRIASLVSTYVTDVNVNGCMISDGPLSPTASNDLSQRFSLLKAVNLNEAFLQSSICPKVGVFRGGIADVLPVTDFQALAVAGVRLESRWMLNYFCLDGKGPLDLRRLKQSCFRVVDAFDILRTVFVCSGGRFVQVILRKLRPEFLVYETEDTLEEFTATLQKQDKEHGPRQGEPFVQFSVIREKSSDHHRLLIRLSHAQYDGVSLPRILSAIQSGYQGGPIPSTPSFANYVRVSAETVTSDHYEYWKSLLKDSSMTDIVRRKGPDYCRSTNTAATTLKKTVQIPSIAHGNITTATVIKSAWALTLAKITSRFDVVFGHTISGRNVTIPGVETMVGPCLNVVPVRIRFQEGWAGLDLLRHVQDQQVANMPFEALGFREIVKHCTDWPDWTFFTTIVQHQNVGYQKEMQLGENKYNVRGYGTDDDFTDFTVFSTSLKTGEVEITLNFSLNSIITTSFSEQILDMLCTTAEVLSSHPTTALPSPSALSDIPSRIIDGPPRPSDEAFLSSHLKDLSRPEILVLSDILSRTWRQVLTDKGGHCPPFQLDSSFFDLNGDIVSLAQVAWLLDQEGFNIRVEDLVEHPTMLGQMAVLKMYSDSKEDEEKGKGPAAAVDQETATTPQVENTEKKTSWSRAVKLARRVVWRNVRRG